MTRASGLPAQSVFQEAGVRGARKRWGIPRTVVLTGLTEEQRVFIIETVKELREAARQRLDGNAS